MSKKVKGDRTITHFYIEPLKNGYEIKVVRNDGTGQWGYGGMTKEERYYERDWDDANVLIMNLLEEQGQLVD